MDGQKDKKLPRASRGGLRLTSAVAVALGGVLAVLVIVLAFRFSVSWEVPVGGGYAVSDRTRDVLANTQGSIKVSCLMDRRHPLYRPVVRLLKGIRQASRSVAGAEIKIEFVDPRWDLARAGQLAAYGVQSPALVFERQNRRVAVPLEELGVRSEELGVRSEELGVRSEELGVRSEELGVRSEELGVRSESAVRLLASGWLDSKAREGVQFRHAVWPGGFGPQPAQDPPAYMLWLASQTKDEALGGRLRELSKEVVASLPEGATGVDGISHVWQPAGALLYGNLDALVRRAGPRARQLAERLADGTDTYTPKQGGPDYASTLGASHCNGFTAIAAEDMLRSATLTGDEDAIRAALAVLDKMTGHYAKTVPRGAQPWEMPLHTPDILASARLVRCYVLGYLLSGNAAYLEQARYWAWTGVTMVYLTNPTQGKVGPYATIGVIGATNWEAPNWIGQPVQWCGLVYAAALNDLARVDAEGGPWKRIASGITLAGLQMTFPIDDPHGRGGLLPDFFLLREQVSDGPAINPGTLQASLAEAFGKTPLYTVTRLDGGMLLHLPGEGREELGVRSEELGVRNRGGEGTARVKVTTWAEGEYRALLTRVPRPPSSVTWDGKPIEARFIEEAKVLVLTLKGSGVLEIKRNQE